MKTQIRNFFRHAEHIGLINALLALVIAAITSKHFHYTDDGVLYSEAFDL